jgi:multiple sugar transport system substrate-binding protein
VGYPGYSNAAIDESFTTWLIPKMFADAATGRLSPEEAMKVYSAQLAAIFDKWRLRKMV